ncbi:hypothetical protein [Christiangramia sp.]|uniref:hypothetical protein n=1 Tax=Christiangramia sp. TaxID=1931228 RepID=UPI0026036D77|nr:hypothetical protein [Christiangramia sp.]
MAKITQRDATRNQSAADFLRCEHIFLFDNHYQAGVFKNTTGAELTLKAGSLVKRGTTANELVPVGADLTLVDTIGIVFIEEDIVLAANETADIHYGIDGAIDETKLELPGATTIDTFPTDGTTTSGKTVKDFLHALGFQLEGSVDNTKYDN